VKGLLRLPIVQSFLDVLTWGYLELVIATMRWRVVNPESVRPILESDRGAIFLFWHGRLTQAIGCRPFLGRKPRRVVISLSRDGDFITRAAARLRFPAIRGSTGRPDRVLGKGGAAAFRQAVECVGAGEVLLVTPDGPRGPREVLPTGPVRLARAGGCPVFLLGLAARPVVGLGSWDRARIPLPFARGCVVVDGPHVMSTGAQPDEIEAGRQAWQARMIAAQGEAEAILFAALRPAPAPTEGARP
jgi:lysophospholipid acyltransferase (LPLAT)-like uncharacterized protein